MTSVISFLKNTYILLNIDESLSIELTSIILEGDPVDIEIEDKNSGSALRALRKLNIDYEIIEQIIKKF